MNKVFSNQLGLKTFAHYLFDLQKTIPQDRFVEVKKEEKKEVPDHVKTWLQKYMEKELKYDRCRN